MRSRERAVRLDLVARQVHRTNLEKGGAASEEDLVRKLAAYLAVQPRTLRGDVEQLLARGELERTQDPATGRIGLVHRECARGYAPAPAEGRRPGPEPAHGDDTIFANREPSEWVRVSRRGRSRGFDVHVDARTLQLACVPIDAPAERIRVRRSAAGRGRIVLEVVVAGEAEGA